MRSDVSMASVMSKISTNKKALTLKDMSDEEDYLGGICGAVRGDDMDMCEYEAGEAGYQKQQVSGEEER